MTPAELRKHSAVLDALRSQYQVSGLRVTSDGHLIVEGAPPGFNLVSFANDVTSAVGQTVWVSVQASGMYQGDPL